MTAFILQLDDPFAADPERVGPKAANLAGLTQAGLPTPGGFALTADAYRQQLRQYLHVLGAQRGAIVYMTSGYIDWTVAS